jgi:glutathione S-transferase
VIKLYQFEISPFCDKVRRILHFKQVPYETSEVNLQQAVTQIGKVNSTGKVPAIEDDEFPVTDSTNIAYYLENKFPTPPLIPEDPALRAAMHILEDWADESLYFYEMYLRFTVPRNAKRWIPVLCANDSELIARAARFVIPRHMQSILDKQGLGLKSKAQILEDLNRHCDAIDHTIKGDWLVGDAITLADIAVFSQLYCIHGTDEGNEAIEARPRVYEWMRRVDVATEKPKISNVTPIKA